MLSLHERQLGGRRTPVAASESHFFFFLKKKKEKEGGWIVFASVQHPRPAREVLRRCLISSGEAQR